MNGITGKTNVLGIIGCPVDHSFSPVMHNFISSKLKKDYVYCAMDVKKEDLEKAISGIRALNIKGVNVTAPHKMEVIKYLDFVSKEAFDYGSVNTIVNENGKLKGYNTDAEGFYLSLVNSGINILGKDILILGAGGAARPICIKLLNEGAKSITVFNRTIKRAEELKDYVFLRTKKEICINFSNKHYDVVINATSAGLGENKDLPISDFSFVDSKTDAFDLIYNPPETPFLSEMKKAGARKAVNGLGMLIYQGLVAYELFTGEKIDYKLYHDVKKEVFGL